jgi:hypothetical protein
MALFARAARKEAAMKKSLVLFAAVVLIALPLLAPAPSVKAQQDPPRWDCCFHIYSAGSNLGWASSLLNYTAIRARLDPADETTFANILRAGQHIQAANATCSAMNPAWTDWQNLQQFLVNQVNAIRQRPDSVIRNQVANNIRSTYLWGRSLRVRVFNNQRYEHDTCAEKYYRLGFLLGYAHQTLLIAQERQQMGRNDWSAPVGDALNHVQEAHKVLNEYFNVAGCTDIRDLDLLARMTNLVQVNSAQLQLMSNAMRAIWEALQQRLQQRCELATGPPPPPPGSGAGLVGIWRGNHPQSPTIRFDLVNGEYRGVIVELGFLQNSTGWTVGAPAYTFRHEFPGFFRGQQKSRNPDGTFYWKPQTLTLVGPDELVFGSGANNRWRRVFTP